MDCLCGIDEGDGKNKNGSKCSRKCHNPFRAVAEKKRKEDIKKGKLDNSGIFSENSELANGRQSCGCGWCQKNYKEKKMKKLKRTLKAIGQSLLIIAVLYLAFLGLFLVCNVVVVN